MDVNVHGEGLIVHGVYYGLRGLISNDIGHRFIFLRHLPSLNWSRVEEDGGKTG